jgi:hypothetical protein
MSPAHYEITVKGHLDQAHWSRWFDGMQVTLKADGTTVLSGPVADQAALHGLLGKVRDLGLVLISVQSQSTTDPLDPRPPASPGAGSVRTAAGADQQRGR